MDRRKGLHVVIWSAIFIVGLLLGHALAPSSYRNIYMDDLPATASFVINTDGTTIWATRYDGKIVYSGSDAQTIIQNALDALSSGRTWKEKVVLKGSFTMSKYNISVSSYTIIEGSGSTLKTADGLVYDNDWAYFMNTGSLRNVEIRNLVFDDNYAGSPGEWAYFLNFSNAENLTVKDCMFITPKRVGDNYWIDLGGDNVFFEKNSVFGNDQVNFGSSVDSTKKVCIRENYFEDCALFIRRAGVVEDNIFSGIAESTIYSSYVEVVGNWANISQCFVGLSGSTAKNIRIANNFVYSSATSYNLIESQNSASCVDISGNFLHGGSIVIEIVLPSSNITIKENIIEYSTNYCLCLQNNIDNGWVEGNVIRNNVKGIHLMAGNKDWTIINNFFHNNTDYDISWADLTGNVVIKRNIGFVTENSSVSELANDDWFAHGCAGEPDQVLLTVEETDANYCIQLKAKNSTHCQVYLYDLSGSAPETVAKTVHWRVVYEP